MKWAFLGNPNNRRGHFFAEAVQQQGFPAPLLYSYRDILEGTLDLRQALANVDCLRIESPGEDAEVARWLLRWGSNHPNLGTAPRLSDQELTTYAPTHGRLAYQRQQHLGYLTLLDVVERALAPLPALSLVNSLDFIRCCFDKPTCHRRLAAAGLAVAPAFYQLKGYDDFRAQLRAHGWSAAFVKPWHGSSAAGVLAYRRQGAREQVVTSVEVVQGPQGIELYNSLSLRTYRDAATIGLLLDTLAQEGAYVERWLPKAGLKDGALDLRVVVIGGRACHTVVRQSRSPLTNLHLGNQRGSLEAVQTRLGEEGWARLMHFAEAAAAALPPHTYVGLDLLIKRDWKTFCLLEANAFGDLLPRVLHKGHNTYRAVVHHLASSTLHYG